MAAPSGARNRQSVDLDIQWRQSLPTQGRHYVYLLIGSVPVPATTFLTTTPPSWYTEIELASVSPTSLDLSSAYVDKEWWEGRKRTSKASGMPEEHFHFAIQSIGKYPSITSLNLSKCNIGARKLQGSASSLATLALALRLNANLKTLILSDNSIDLPDMERFINTVFRFNFGLTHLEWNDRSLRYDDKRGLLAVNAEEKEDSLFSLNEVFIAHSRTINRLIEVNTHRNALIEAVLLGKSDVLDLTTSEFASNLLQLDCATLNHLLLLMGPRLKHLILPFLVTNEGGNASSSPTELFRQTALETLSIQKGLNLSGTGPKSYFTTIPSSLSNLRVLKVLNLSFCGIESLDGDQTDEHSLSSKFASRNSLIFSNLVHLESLSLHGNNIKRLPTSLGCCASLTFLSVVRNHLEVLPHSILLLTRLQQLWAWANQLQQFPISFPIYCKNLVDVRIFSQGSSGKRNLPVPGLTRSLADSFRKQENIASFSTKSKRSSTSSPVSIRFGSTRLASAIDEKASTPLSFGTGKNSPTPCTDLLLHLRNYVSTSRQVRSNRFKLIFVGDGGIGKTTTLRAFKQYLNRGSSDATEENILDNFATDGVDMSTLALPMTSSSSSSSKFESDYLFFTCWDFAGQDVYSYSHPFFLTQQSIYLIGFDCSLADQGIERVDYWLHTIRARFPKAPCILFGTHIDLLSPAELSKLKDTILSRYNLYYAADGSLKSNRERRGMASPDRLNIHSLHFVSNSKGIGVAELLDELKSAPIMMEKLKRRAEIPMSWVLLEERGHTIGSVRPTPLITWDEWKSSAKRDLGIDEAELKEATAYWHEVGSISWFNDDGLRDFVCVRPNFLADTFSSVISAKIGLNSSILRHDALPQIWKGLDESLFPYLLQVLEKFEILHKLDDDFLPPSNSGPQDDRERRAKGLPPLAKGFSVVPAMLPESEPPQELLGAIWPPVKQGVMEYTRMYTFEFVPNGFFSRILVRLLQSKWTPLLWWRYGILLWKRLAKIYLRFEAPRRTIILKVRGPEAISKIGSLIDSISALIANWLPLSRVVITVPYLLSDGKTTDYIDWRDIEKAAQTGSTEMTLSKLPGQPRVRIDHLAPDLALMTHSTKVFTAEELKMDKELGRGGYAVVLRGTMPSGEVVACKKLLLGTMDVMEHDQDATASEVFTEFRREVWLMSALHHPNLVRLVGVCTKPNLVMVLEFMEGGNLFNYLHGDGISNSPAVLTLEDRFALALGIADGMCALHALNPPIIHRDLKSPNILLTFRSSIGQQLQVPIPKVADFGLSRGLVWMSSLSTRVVDNPMWLAPEVILKKPYNEKADVYAFGVILYEICTQTFFLSHLKFDSQKEDAIKKGERPTLPDDLHPIMRSLITMCWAQAPELRPAFSQVVDCLKSRIPIDQPLPSTVNFGTGWEDFDGPST